MKRSVFLLLFTGLLNAHAQQRLLVDTHNDVLSYQIRSKVDLAKLQDGCNFDLVRAARGGLGGQVFSIWCGDNFGKGRAFNRANREIDSLYALVNRNPDKLVLVRTAKELQDAYKHHRLAAMIGVEGGHMIEDRMDYLDSLIKRGLCYLTLTWNNSTPWATSAYDETTKRDSLTHLGLTDFGKQVVRRLNAAGAMVDVSHVGEATFYDVLKTSTKPVIASHSCAYALNPISRNLKDEQLKALAKNGGVVFVNFYSGFLDPDYHRKADQFSKLHKSELDSLSHRYGKDSADAMISEKYKSETDQIRAPLSLLAKHIDYIAKLVGVAHVGIGSDFDGCESFPLGLDSVSDYPKVAEELEKLGYGRKEIDQIFGGNFLRVLAANRGQ